MGRHRRPEITSELKKKKLVPLGGVCTYFCKAVRIGSGLFGNFGGACGEKVAGDESKVGGELAGFRIGDDELSEGSEMLYCLVSIALGVLLGREVAAIAGDGLSLVLCGLPEAFIRGVPDELL